MSDEKIERLRNATYAVNDEGLVGKAMELRDAIDDLEALLDPAPTDQWIVERKGAAEILRRKDGSGGIVFTTRYGLADHLLWMLNGRSSAPTDQGAEGSGDEDYRDGLNYWATTPTETTEGLVRVELTREEAEAMLMGLDSAPWTDAVSTTFAKITAALADEGENDG